jgi:hypothetical protein
MGKEWREHIRALKKIDKDRYIYVSHFYGLRVADNEHRSTFALVGWAESFTDKDIFMFNFPERHVFEVIKGKTGKYKENMKQLRVSEKMKVGEFPKM